MVACLRSSIAALLLVAMMWGSTEGAERRFEKKFSVSPGGKLALQTDAGSVLVKGGSSGEVQILAELRGAKAEVEGFEISATQTAETIEVRGDARRSSKFSLFRRDVNVKYVVTVPPEYNLRIRTAGGDIEINRSKGDVEAETSGGDVRVNGVEGHITVKTSGGDIHAEKVAGYLRARTSGGDIAMRTLSAEVDVSTSGGDIRLAGVEGKVSAATSGGDIALKMIDARKGVRAETSGGSITLSIPPSTAAEIDASTSGGDVRCTIPVTTAGKLEESRLRGTMNGGGSLILLRTTGGDVTIRTAE
jgi:DUF4097 and DUF4098 domain-containing protein YvlB